MEIAIKVDYLISNILQIYILESFANFETLKDVWKQGLG